MPSVGSFGTSDPGGGKKRNRERKSREKKRNHSISFSSSFPVLSSLRHCRDLCWRCASKGISNEVLCCLLLRLSSLSFSRRLQTRRRRSRRRLAAVKESVNGPCIQRKEREGEKSEKKKRRRRIGRRRVGKAFLGSEGRPCEDVTLQPRAVGQRDKKKKKD